MLHRSFSFAYFFLFTVGLNAQGLTGLWEGSLYQEGKTDTFYYRLQLEQEGDDLSGNSFSRSPDGQSTAEFSFTGVVDDDKVVIQEIIQMAPEAPKWCLKYMLLRIGTNNGKVVLEGDWKADGCTPGKVYLENGDFTTKEITIEEEIPFSILGKWTGHLSQSDREYGFYYEINLQEGDESESYIVSEGNGGSAYHELDWEYDEITGNLDLEEAMVKIKTDDKWKWCIKSGSLSLRREPHTYVLEGEWKGFIEGFNFTTGSCAPGKFYLEKPIETRTITKAVQEARKPYESKNERKIKVQRILEVQSPKLKIKTWDNGTVDGDIVTLFLNGNLLFEKYRVAKTKYTKLVTLKEENNFLILHAESLGDIPPNTVAVSIDDGVKEQVIILSSNLEESGAVMIKQFKVN